MKFCMVQTNNFTQLCCSKHYSVVRTRKFEFFFHATILYCGNVYCGIIFKCNELQVCRYDAKFRDVVEIDV